MIDLRFTTVRNALDQAFPSEMTAVDVFPGGATPPGFDSGMVMLKGIVAGALAILRAEEVCFISSEDMGLIHLDQNWDEGEFQKQIDEAVESGVSVTREDFSLTFAEHNARIYYGMIHEDSGDVIDLSAPSSRWPGATSSFRVWVKFFEGGTLTKYEGMEGEPEVLDVLTIHLEGEGGAPTLFFFIRPPADREN